jgi:MoaA/NifB/PqqE/SkfB family radical SAM enzyme
MDWLAVKEENSGRLREDWRAGRDVFTGMPEIVALNHSNACNLRCVTCWHHVGVPVHGLRLADVERIAHQVFPTARKVVLTSSGEPLLNHFDEIAALAAQYRTKIDMFTSCVTMTEERFRRTRELFDILHVSVDCPDKAGHERVRVRSDFDRVVANLEMMKRVLEAEGKPFGYHCQAALLKSTARFLPELVRFAHRFLFDVVHVQRVFRTHSGLEAEDVLTQLPRAELDAIVREASAEARACNVSLVLHELGYPNVWSEPLPKPEDPRLMNYGEHGVCWFVGQSIGIGNLGEVHPCCYPTGITLGSALEQPLGEIWNGEPMRALRRQFHARRLNDVCAACFLVRQDPLSADSLDVHRRSAHAGPAS